MISLLYSLIPDSCVHPVRSMWSGPEAIGQPLLYSNNNLDRDILPDSRVAALW